MSSRRRRRSRVNTLRRSAGRRQLLAEPLEDRRLLTADFHNAAMPLDTNGDTVVSPIDALLVVNLLNQHGAGRLSDLLTSNSAAHDGAEAEGTPVGMVDTNHDDFLSPVDALQVINQLNAEGENGDVVRYTARLFNAEGTEEISTIGVDEEFQLRMFVQDTRMSVDRVGVATAYVDVRYQAGLLTPVAHSTTPPDRNQDPFIDGRGSIYGVSVALGTVARDGLIDLAGGTDLNLLNCSGASSDPFCPGPDEIFMWAANFKADRAGVVTFSPEPTTNVLSDPDDAGQSPTGDTNHYNAENNAIVCPAFNPSFDPPLLQCAGTMGFQNATLTIVEDPSAPIVNVPDEQTVFFSDTLTFTNGNQISVGDADSTDLTATLGLAPDSGTLTATPDGATISGNGSGNVTISGTAAQVNTALNGLAYDPVDNVAQNVTLTVAASDGDRSTSRSVLIHVVPPVQPFTVDDTASVAEGDGSSTLNIDVLDGDLAPTGATNEIVAVTQATNGTVTIVSSGGRGVSVDYTPNADFFGDDSFTYTINAFDAQGNAVGDGESTGTVRVTVSPLNDQPQISVPGGQMVDEGAELDFGNSLSVSDADSPFDTNYSAELTLSVSNGELEASENGATIQNNRSSTVTITGTIAQLNSALNGLKYRPLGALGADDSLSMTIDDLGNEGSIGESHTNQASVAIDVIAQNNDPTITIPAEPPSFIVNFDNFLSADNNNAIQVDDLDAAQNEIQVVLEVLGDSAATLTLSNSSVVTGGTNGTGRVTLQGTVTALNSALDAGVNFRTPNAGSPQITVIANDLGNTGEGGGEDVIRTFDVEVLDFIPSQIRGQVTLTFGPYDLGIEGVTVRLIGQDFLGAAVELTAMTNRHGEYLFEDIRPGEYTLEEVQPMHMIDGPDALTEILTADGDDNNDRGLVRIGIRGNVVSLDNHFRELGLSAAFAGALNPLLASTYRDGGLQGILFGSGGWSIFLGDSWDDYSHGRMTLAENSLSATVTAASSGNDRSGTVHHSSARLRVFHGSGDENVTLIRGTPAEVFGGGGEGEASGKLAQIQRDPQAVQQQHCDAVDQVMQAYSIA